MKPGAMGQGPVMKKSVWMYEREFILMLYGALSDKSVGAYYNRRIP